MTTLGRIEGTTLEEAWPKHAGTRKTVRRRAERRLYLGPLSCEGFKNDRLQSPGGEPLYSAFLFRNDRGRPNGPSDSDDELWDGMAEALEGLPDKSTPSSARAHAIRQAIEVHLHVGDL